MPRTTPPLTKPVATKKAASKSVGAKKAATQRSMKWKATDKESKSTKGGPPVPGSKDHPLKQRLKPTETPGVFESEMGVRTDYRGVALAILSIKSRSEDQEREVLGKLAETPAEVLKVFALDRSLSPLFRADCAAKAAPYVDRKMPTAIDGGVDPQNPNGPGLPINLSDLRGLSGGELSSLKALLEKAKQAGGS